MSFLKSIFADGNKINEGNIILSVLTFMLVVIDIVALVKNLDIFSIHLAFWSARQVKYYLL